jgi:hypothetical protein
MKHRGMTYDTGALLAGEAGRRDLWLLHRRLLARGLQPVVPAPVLAQAWRGGPQPLLSRLLAGCTVQPLAERLARATGAALAASGTADVADATVVVGAAARGDAVLTSDPADIGRIADAIGAPLAVHGI